LFSKYQSEILSPGTSAEVELAIQRVVERALSQHQHTGQKVFDAAPLDASLDKYAVLKGTGLAFTCNIACKFH
jgi:hypothetical protein